MQCDIDTEVTAPVDVLKTKAPRVTICLLRLPEPCELLQVMSSQDGAPLNIPGLVKKQGPFVFFKASGASVIEPRSEDCDCPFSMFLDVPWRLEARGGWPTTCALARKRSSSSRLGRRLMQS